ncbi:VOC family protein [Microlunatus sp. Y2014]|uniref:VOC family protein n=1 Tax=Microlunatus sp. Y2014 TaxID=3418488 RepID=UPI003DA6CEF8
MTYTMQVTVDSAAPHQLAGWWADILGWEVEPSDEEFIRSMIDQGFTDEADTMVHNGVLVWRAGQAIRHPEALTGAPRLLFQLSSDPKQGKNRVHLDLRGEEPVPDDERQRILAAGATELWSAEQGPHRWTTYADPEGNEFCL